MIFADFTQTLGKGTFMMFIMIAVAIHYAKKFAAANPAVKTHAKDAAARGAVTLLSKLFKR